MQLAGYAIAVVLVAAIAAPASGCGGEDSGRSSEGSDAPTRLFLTGKRALWVVDVDREAAERYEPFGLAPGDPPYTVLARGDRVVVWGGHRAHALDPDLERQPEPLVDHEPFIVFIPSAHPDRIWIGLVDPERRSTRRLSAVREVSADGEVTVADRRPPGGQWPDAATDEGLLLSEQLREGDVVVWDPRSGAVVRRLQGLGGDTLGPTSGNLVASTSWPYRELRLTDVGTGEQRRVPAPEGFIYYGVRDGEFSPGGELLAVPVRQRAKREDVYHEEPVYPKAPRRLALVDPGSGELTIVEGSRVPDGYNHVVWAAGGDEVFITGGFLLEEQVIVAYRLGDDRARRLDVELSGFTDVAGI